MHEPGDFCIILESHTNRSLALESLLGDTAMAATDMPIKTKSGLEASARLDNLPRDTAIAAMDIEQVPEKIPKSSKTLDTLPGEIQNMIYGYLVGGVGDEYNVLPIHKPKYPKRKPDRHLLRPLDVAQALFLTSKSVRHVAMDVFFFHSLICWDFDPWQNLSFRKAPTHRIMNVQLLLDMDWHNDKCYTVCDEDSNLSRALRLDRMNVIHQVLEDFGGTEILRRMMRIRFKDCSIHTHRIIPTKYFQALTELTGFHTVVVQISMERFLYCPIRVCSRQLSDCDQLRAAMRDVLEPALGPAELGYVTRESTECVAFDEYHFLEFHPQRYLAQLKRGRPGELAERSHQELGNSDAGDLRIDAGGNSKAQQ